MQFLDLGGKNQMLLQCSFLIASTPDEHCDVYFLPESVLVTGFHENKNWILDFYTDVNSNPKHGSKDNCSALIFLSCLKPHLKKEAVHYLILIALASIASSMLPNYLHCSRSLNPSSSRVRHNTSTDE